MVAIVSFFLRDSWQGSFVFELFLGIVAAALGLLFLLRPVIVASVLPVILGLFIVVDGLVNLKRALELRRMLYLRWTVPLALSAGSAVLGLVIVFQPSWLRRPWSCSSARCSSMRGCPTCGLSSG